MRFEKRGDNKYNIDLILAATIQADIDGEMLEQSVPRLEGKTKVLNVTMYERDPANRRMAIAYHGLRCVVCGFHFGETYGVRGEGFTEVHHNKPLAASGKVQVIDPKTDLTSLCANCHRMMHRSKYDVLSIEELRELIRANNVLEAMS